MTKRLRGTSRAGWKSAGHAVEAASDGNAGLRLGAVQSFDVMIIDRMLPGLDGLSIVESLRTSGIRTPVLLLTSLGGIEDRVDGLDAGADDYLVKPFAIAELRARVNALGRRLGNDNDSVLKVADLELNVISRTVVRNGRKDRSRTARASPARSAHAQCRPVDDPEDAARAGVGFPFRS